MSNAAPQFTTPDPRDKKIATVCFIAILLTPYLILPDAVVVVFMTTIAIIVPLSARRLRLNMPASYWLLAAFVALHFIFAFFSADRADIVLSQSNHFIQLLVMFPAMIHIANTCDWQYELTRPRMMLALSASCLITLAFIYITQGRFGFHEHSPATIFLLCSLLCLSADEKRGKIIISLFVFFMSIICFSRTTPMAISLIFLTLYVFHINRFTILLVTLLVLFFPIIFYLTAEDSALRAILLFDHNTYIRAEFMRGAIDNIENHLFFGNGFGTPFRDTKYYYITNHPFLRNMEQALIISNHHSIFDTALRLGLAGAFLLLSLLFMRSLRAPWSAPFAFLVVVLALGVGINAWFEDQSQLIQVIVIAALLNSTNWSSTAQRGADRAVVRGGRVPLR